MGARDPAAHLAQRWFSRAFRLLRQATPKAATVRAHRMAHNCHIPIRVGRTLSSLTVDLRLAVTFQSAWAVCDSVFRRKSEAERAGFRERCFVGERTLARGDPPQIEKILRIRSICPTRNPSAIATVNGFAGSVSRGVGLARRRSRAGSVLRGQIGTFVGEPMEVAVATRPSRPPFQTEKILRIRSIFLNSNPSFRQLAPPHTLGRR